MNVDANVGAAAVVEFTFVVVNAGFSVVSEGESVSALASEPAEGVAAYLAASAIVGRAFVQICCVTL